MGKIKIDCASCDTVVRVEEDKVTARTRCPKCGSVLQAAAGPAEAIEEDEDEEPAPRPSRPQKSSARRKTGSARPRPGPAAEEDEPEEDAARERASPTRQDPEIAAWKKVRIGLLVLLIVTAAGLISTIVGQFIGMFAWRWILTSLRTSLVLWLSFSLCSLVATLAAYVLIGFTPRRYAPRSLIGAVIGIDLLTNACLVLVIVLVWRGLGATGEGGLILS